MLLNKLIIIFGIFAAPEQQYYSAANQFDLLEFVPFFTVGVLIGWFPGISFGGAGRSRSRSLAWLSIVFAPGIPIYFFLSFGRTALFWPF